MKICKKCSIEYPDDYYFCEQCYANLQEIQLELDSPSSLSLKNADLVENQTTSSFGLTYEQTRILFSYQYHLTIEDVSHESPTKDGFWYSEKSEHRKERKIKWLEQWKESCENFLKGQINGDNQDYHLITDYNELNVTVGELSKTLHIRTPLYLMLMETILFHPYYPLQTSEENPYKGLTFCVQQKIDLKLEEFRTSLGIEKGIVSRIRQSYDGALKEITGFWSKLLVGGAVGAVVVAVTAGFAAPTIAALLAGGGLSGAAATTAGLAALGGGAISAGGFGMAGGIAVIVGGGAILGMGTGVGTGYLLSVSPDFALTESAKLEVVMKEIVLNTQKDVRFAQELIKEQRNAIKSLEDELFTLKMAQDRNESKIGNLEKSISYLKAAIERNMEYYREAT